MACSPFDQKLLASCSSSGSVKLWSVESHRLLVTFTQSHSSEERGREWGEGGERVVGWEARVMWDWRGRLWFIIIKVAWRECGIYNDVTGLQK